MSIGNWQILVCKLNLDCVRRRLCWWMLGAECVGPSPAQYYKNSLIRRSERIVFALCFALAASDKHQFGIYKSRLSICSAEFIQAARKCRGFATAINGIYLITIRLPASQHEIVPNRLANHSIYHTYCQQIHKILHSYFIDFLFRHKAFVKFPI